MYRTFLARSAVRASPQSRIVSKPFERRTFGILSACAVQLHSRLSAQGVLVGRTYQRWLSEEAKAKVQERRKATPLETRVFRIVSEQLGVKDIEVTAEKSFVDDLGADSLDMVELVMALEEEFDTEISDEDGEKITTVQAAVDYIQTHHG